MQTNQQMSTPALDQAHSLGELMWPQTAHLRTIDDLIEEYAEELDRNGGDLEAIPAIAAFLAYKDEEVQQHIERLGLKVLSLNADEEAVKIERQRLQARETRWRKAAVSLKGYIKRLLNVHEVKKVKTPSVSISLVQNGGRPSVRITDEAQLEVLYQTGSPFVQQIVTYRLDTEAVLAAQERGETLPPEILVERGQHVRIS